MRFPLTGFADEISPDLDIQVQTLARLGLTGLDLRSVGGVNIMDMTLEEIERVGEVCRAHGIVVQAIGSPVNKIAYDIMLQGRERERLRKAIKAASLVNCNRVRIFTPEVPEDQHQAMATTILEWMLDQRRLAEEFGVTLIHENDGKYWGAYPENAKRLFGEVGNSHFKAAFDFANTLLLGFKPFDDWFPWILPYLDTLHIKDAKDGKVLPAGEGDGQIEATMKWLVEQGWQGPLTMEPHLSAAGPFGGYSGEQLFEAAVVAFRGILARVGAEA